MSESGVLLCEPAQVHVDERPAELFEKRSVKYEGGQPRCSSRLRSVC